jgi:hypothetical protein
MTAVAAAVGAAGAIPLLLGLWSWYSNRLHVKHITDPDDPDLIAVWELQTESFRPEIADDLNEMRSWVAGSSGRNSLGDHHYTFVVLALKERQTICGYVYAQYYESRRIIFLSYLVLSRSKMKSVHAAQKGAVMLLRILLRKCSRRGAEWQAVVTEVEEDPVHNNRSARAKMALFQNAAKKLSAEAGRSAVPVFKLPLDYVQPALRPEDISATRARPNRQWLLYAPRSDKGLVTVDGKYFMTKTTTAHLLETLLMYCYADTFPDSPEYQHYIKGEFDRYLGSLTERTELTKNPRLA